MADGVGIKTGEDATIASDDAGAAGQVQIIKLAVSADGSAALVGADANGLDVDVTRTPGTAADGGEAPAVNYVLAGYDGSAVQRLVTDASGFLQTDDPAGLAVLEAIQALATTIDADTGGMLIALQTLDNAIAGNEMQVDVVGALPAGTNKIGDVGISTRTSGGCETFRSLDVDESEEQIKGTAGQVYGYYFFNAAASTRYLKLYNATEANVTVGTTEPKLTLPLPKESAGHIGFPAPAAFSTAITVACTTGLADNNTGAPSANDVIVNVFYA